jgi:UDP-N-acetylglucosamine acyltransferase
MIHPTAIIHPAAKVDPTAQIGPFSVIGEHVEIGPGTVIGPHASFTGRVTMGEGNRFHAGCVIGDEPQDLKYKGEPTGVRIGSKNVFREFATVHRSNSVKEETVVGSNNLFMVNSHVGHNSQVGDHVILANGALLGGHVTVGDRAFLSGNCCVHQFVRVGTLSMMQGSSAISRDLPPYSIAKGGVNILCGLNVVGLRRAGISAADRLELKKVYRTLFRDGLKLKEAIAMALEEFKSEPARVLIDFVASSKRGLCADVGFAGHEEE